MKLTVLVDNNTLTDRYFIGEPGLSFFIEDLGHEILFDVGYTDAFLQNARKMNLPLTDIDTLVFSHGHLDHTWGIDALVRFYTEAKIENIPFSKPKLIAHPAVLNTKTVAGIPEIGTIIAQDKIARHFDIQFSKDPIWLTDRLVFLGEIERKHSFEGNNPMGKTIKGGTEEEDRLLDDTALAYKAQDGLVVVTGCSHSGICNIVDYAKNVCGVDRVVDVVGGFHLLNPSPEQLKGTLDFFKELRPKTVHACHCTDLPSKIALARTANLEEVGVGLQLEYD